MDTINGRTNGAVDEVIATAKRAKGELGTAPDFVPAGYGQQTLSCKELENFGERSGEHTIGWKLDRDLRAELLARFAPRHAFTIADHVTLRANVAADVPMPPAVRGEIVGQIDDGKGVEALIVAIDGSTERPGGGTYHITWSLGPGHRARESNDVIDRLGWKPLAASVPLILAPANFR